MTTTVGSGAGPTGYEGNLKGFFEDFEFIAHSVGMKYSVGEMIALTNSRIGEIKFKGKVKFDKGTYYGLELFSTPGEHNGTYRGVRYFKTYGNRGILIRKREIQGKCIPRGNQTGMARRQRAVQILHYTGGLGGGGYQIDDEWSPNTTAIETGKEDEEDVLAATRKAAYEALMAATAKKESDKRRLELAERNAREKMAQIENRERELTQLRARSEHLQIEIDRRNEDIQNRIEYYDAQKAEVETAKGGVHQITDLELYELRTYPDPPELIVRFVKSLMVLLDEPMNQEDDMDKFSSGGGRSKSWQDGARVMARKNFLQRLINFNTNGVTKAQRVRVEGIFGNREDFNFEVLDNASKACGPLADFIQAEIEFAALLQSRNIWEREIEAAKKAARDNAKEKAAVDKMIRILEGEVAEFKAQYQQLILRFREIQRELGQYTQSEVSVDAYTPRKSQENYTEESSQPLPHRPSPKARRRIESGEYKIPSQSYEPEELPAVEEAEPEPEPEYEAQPPSVVEEEQPASQVLDVPEAVEEEQPPEEEEDQPPDEEPPQEEDQPADDVVEEKQPEPAAEEVVYEAQPPSEAGDDAVAAEPASKEPELDTVQEEEQQPESDDGGEVKQPEPIAEEPPPEEEDQPSDDAPAEEAPLVAAEDLPTVQETMLGVGSDEDLRAIYDALDKDKSGGMTLKELSKGFKDDGIKEILEARGLQNNMSIMSKFSKMNEDNGDNTLTFEEFRDYMNKEE